MPNPNSIDVPNLGFTDVQMIVLHIMVNKKERDYSTADEIARSDELSAFSHEEVSDAMTVLNRRGFLFEVKKPYGYVYAVNKLRISNMEFVYGT